MEIALEKSTETNAALKIKLFKDDYQLEVNKKLKEYSRRVSLKGFRPGKVPSALIQKMYGKSVLVDEINGLLKKTISSYIRDNRLQVVGDPIPNRNQAAAIDWDNQTDFEFSYDLGLASDFIVDFDQLPSVSAYEIQATNQELNETIENLQAQFSGQIHVEESAEGDMVYGELKQLNGQSVEKELLLTKTALPLKQVAANALSQFIGLKKGDKVTVDLQKVFTDEKALALATGLKREDAIQLEGEFEFTVEDVTRNEPAEINQAFFDKVLGKGVVEDEEQFRERVLDIIKRNYVRETAALLRQDIEKVLLDSIAIELPDEFMKNWLQTTNESNLSEGDVEHQYSSFSRSVKLQLIKNKIAETDEINVSYEEVLEVTRQMIREQFGFYGENDQMAQTIDRVAQNYLMEEKGDHYMKIYNRVFDDKVIELIKNKLTLEQKTITMDEFKTLVSIRQA